MLAESNITAAILCDDIRREASGKLLLVGVTYADLAVPKLPHTIRFALHVEGYITKQGRYSPSIIVRDDVGGVLFNQKGVLREHEPIFNLGRFAASLEVNITLHRLGSIFIYHEVSGIEQLVIQRQISMEAPPHTALPYPPR